MFHRFERWLNPFPQEASTPLPGSAWRFLWGSCEGVRGSLLALAICTASLGLLEAWLYRMLARLVDELAAQQIAGAGAMPVTSLGVLMLALSVATLLVVLQAGLKYQVITVNFVTRLRWNYHRVLLGKDLTFFARNIAGRLAATMMQCALAVRVVSVVMADALVYVAVYFATLAAVAATLSPVLLLPFIAWLLAYGAALFHFVPRIGKRGIEQAGARARVAGHVADAYANATALKVFSSVEQELDQMRPAMHDLLDKTRLQLRLVSGFELANQLASVLLIASTAGLGTWLWSRGEVGIGAVAATIATAIRLHGIAQFVMSQMTLLFDNLGVIQDGATILGGARQAPASRQAAPLRWCGGDIRIDELTFAYGSCPPVLKGIHLHIRAGEKLGIVGASGAGKSTLVLLLLGLLEPTHGRIQIDGQDLRDVCGQSLRRHIALVSQDTALVHRSIADNIALGRPQASRQQIEQAAKAAGAADFIKGLSDPWGHRGYDAIVGDRGLTLSGGQRQRIALARALLCDSPILVMDEPTSSLDAQTEAVVMEELSRHMTGKTVISITHKLTHLQNMDRVLVLQDGRIKAAGPHVELLERCDVYSQMWTAQEP